MNRDATDLPAHLKVILTPIAEPCFRRYKVVLHCTPDPCPLDRSGRAPGWDGMATPAGSSPSADVPQAEPSTAAGGVDDT
jgi:hypothetical protein